VEFLVGLEVSENRAVRDGKNSLEFVNGALWGGSYSLATARSAQKLLLRDSGALRENLDAANGDDRQICTWAYPPTMFPIHGVEDLQGSVAILIL
jgi:hypothetical protein